MSEPAKNIKPKKVIELLTENFFIRSYQRGYRWTKSQVEDLLNDINEFTPNHCNNANS